ncbi:MAG: YybS family protein [Desulfobacterales bacterium]|nr:YybS family protein [Desulfobacterales bacterium]
MPLSITHPVFIKETFTGIIFCLVIYGVVFAFPLLGVFVLLFLPLPVLFYRLKLGRHSGALIAGTSFFILVLIANAKGPAFDTFYFGLLLVTGMVLGECLERHMSIQKTMGLTALLGVGAVFAVFMIYTIGQGRSVSTIMTDYMNQSLSIAKQLSPEIGMDQDMTQRLIASLMIVMPAMFIVSFVTTLWLNILIIKKLLQVKGITIKSIEHLNRYKAPDMLVWVFIGCATASMILSGPVKIFGINCLIVLMLVYFFQGIAVVSFFFQQKNTPMALKGLCYFLIAVQVYVLILVIGLGFFDNWIDFRKLTASRK